VERHAVAGVLASYAFQLDVFGSAHVREGGGEEDAFYHNNSNGSDVGGVGGSSPLGSGMRSGGDTDAGGGGGGGGGGGPAMPPRILLGPLYAALCRNPHVSGSGVSKARLTFLRSLISRIFPETIDGLHEERGEGGEGEGKSYRGGILGGILLTQQQQQQLTSCDIKSSGRTLGGGGLS